MTSESPSKTKSLWLHESKSREAEMILSGKKGQFKVQAERKLARDAG